jgi:hypothetical protein
MDHRGKQFLKTKHFMVGTVVQKPGANMLATRRARSMQSIRTRSYAPYCYLFTRA